MKTILTVRLSDDGNLNKAFTNVKALFNGIENIYTKETINDKPYNYRNLANALKESSKNNQYYKRAVIDCSYNCSITIEEIVICTK